MPHGVDLLLNLPHRMYNKLTTNPSKWSTGYRSSVRQHFLSYRTVHTWNNLPANSTDFSNLRSFKRGLNSSFLARHSAVYYF